MESRCIPLSMLTLALLAAPLAASEAPAAELPLEDLFLPAPETKACARCVGGFTTYTPPSGSSHWGLGTSCAAAQTDLLNQLYVAAASICASYGTTYQGSCDVDPVLLGCSYNPSYQKYVKDGYVNFGCMTRGPLCQN